MSPRHTGKSSDTCPTREILDLVGDKWSIFIVTTLSDGPRRFNELKREIGIITQRMLTLNLRSLERDGLLVRTVTPSIPPRVDYELTPLGSTLVTAIMPLVAWADSSQKAIRTARKRFESRNVG